jgi:PAS domain S-box-containing protein
MTAKPTYEELEREVEALRKKVDEHERSGRLPRDGQERFRAVVETVRDAVILVDYAGRISYWNPAARGLFGYAGGKAVGLELELLIPERYRQAYKTALSSARVKDLDAVAHKKFVSEALKKDGTEFPIEFSVSPVLIKEESYVLLWAMDITDRRRMEESLRDSELQYRVILNAMGDAIHVVDPELRFILFNKNFERLNRDLGLEADVVGKTLFEVFPFLPDRVRDEYRRVFESGKMFLSEETTRIGDREFMTEARKIPVFSGGKVTHIITVIRDVTRSRLAEDAIKESEARFRTVFEAAPLGIVVSTPEGKILEANKAFCRMLDHTVEDVVNMDFFDITHPEDRPVTRRLTDEVRNGTRDFYEIEKRYLGKDGRTVEVVVRATGTRDSEGRLTYWLGIIEDLTERRRAERALRKSEENFRSLVEDAPYGMSVMRSDRTFEYFNPRFKEIFGYTEEDLPDKETWFRKAYPEKEYRDRIKSIWTADTREGTRTGRLKPRFFKVRCKDGQDKIIHFRAVTFQDGRQFITYQDVTAQAEAEKALQWELSVNSALAKLSHTLISSPYDIREIADLILAHAKEITGSEYGHVSAIDPEADDNSDQAPAEMFTGPDNVEGQGIAPPIGPEDRGPVKNFISIPVKIGDEVVGRIALANPGREYTDRDLHALEQMSELYALALHRQRSDDEKRTLEDQLLQAQKMEAIGTLAGGIAHDFNNLLMGIQGRISLMLMETTPGHPFFKNLRGVEEHVRSAAHLTNQLLGFARGGKYEVTPTDLNALVRSSTDMFGRTRKEIIIHAKHASDIRTVEVDRRQIEQVLLNLYVNAWQAMPGGGEIFVETANVFLDACDVRPYGLEPGNYLKISVTDTGTGMDEATRQRIFDPFFTTKGMGLGTGLGLASAYGIIKNHGGFITVYSEEGTGTTFNIHLPASTKEVPKEKEPAEGIMQGSGTILLVDDEDVIIDVGRKVLEKIGYKVLVAGSGEAALERYRENRDEIDLVILDMIMPGMDGGRTYDGLKEIDPHIKVLLSSGYSLNDQAARILKRGCNSFIQKPFNIKELSQALKEILDKK